MSEPRHTPGPWDTYDNDLWGDAHEDVLIFSKTEGEETPEEVCLVLGHCDAAVRAGNIRLIAAAPDLLAELNDTAVWLTSRATFLRQLADQAPGVMRKRNEHLRQLRDEAARLEGRAAVIRQTILKATTG